MGMTRGEFLRSLAAGAGAAITGLTALGAQYSRRAVGAEAIENTLPAAERNRQLTERLNKDAFTRNVNTDFRILDKESPTVVEAQLVEVREVGSSEEYEQFSLLFKGPREPLLSQKTYAFEHSRMGTFDLFIVPIAADKGGTSYEAVFNRKRE